MPLWLKLFLKYKVEEGVETLHQKTEFEKISAQALC